MRDRYTAHQGAFMLQSFSLTLDENGFVLVTDGTLILDATSVTITKAAGGRYEVEVVRSEGESTLRLATGAKKDSFGPPPVPQSTRDAARLLIGLADLDKFKTSVAAGENPVRFDGHARALGVQPPDGCRHTPVPP